MTARIWSAVYLETEGILKTIVRLLTKTLTMVLWANAGVTICWLGYDGFQLHEMKPLVPLLRNILIKYFFLRGRPRRMFWFSLRFQEFSWWKRFLYWQLNVIWEYKTNKSRRLIQFSLWVGLMKMAKSIDEKVGLATDRVEEKGDASEPPGIRSRWLWRVPNLFEGRPRMECHVK